VLKMQFVKSRPTLTPYRDCWTGVSAPAAMPVLI
jgi:hypothetical protein